MTVEQLFCRMFFNLHENHQQEVLSIRVCTKLVHLIALYSNRYNLDTMNYPFVKIATYILDFYSMPLIFRDILICMPSKEQCLS